MIRKETQRRRIEEGRIPMKCGDCHSEIFVTYFEPKSSELELQCVRCGVVRAVGAKYSNLVIRKLPDSRRKWELVKDKIAELKKLGL